MEEVERMGTGRGGTGTSRGGLGIVEERRDRKWEMSDINGKQWDGN